MLNKTIKNRQARSLFSFGIFHFIDDGFTDSIYLLLPFIAAELNLSFGEVGLLKGIFSGAMSLLQVPLSFLGEKIGELTVIMAGVFGLSAGFLLLSRVYTFPAMIVSLIIAKGAIAGQHGLSSSILSRVFEVSGRRAAMGTYNFSGDMGKVCIPFLLAVMISLWGWRQAVFVLSIGGLVLGTFLYILTRQMRSQPLMPEPDRKSVREGKKEKGLGIRNRKGFSALLTIGIIDNMGRTALLTFLPFLFLQKGIQADKVGFALTLLFVGGAMGKFACGVIAEWVGIIPMVVGTEVLTAVGILSLTWFSASVIWVILPLVGIVLNGTSSVLYATVAEIIPPETRSRGYGFYYAVTLGCGAISPVLYGFLTDALGLTFAIMITALMVLGTVPLSRYLKGDNS